MSVKPRTIDNLGIDTSSRYARDKSTINTQILEDSRFVPLKTEISVVTPYLPTEFEEYNLPGKLTLWASFAPPPDYYSYGKAFFSYQLIPSLGNYEKQEADTDKLEALEDTLNKSFKDQKGQYDHKERERERKTLLKMLKMMGKLDRTLTLINARRNQYQKG